MSTQVMMFCFKDLIVRNIVIKSNSKIMRSQFNIYGIFWISDWNARGDVIISVLSLAPDRNAHCTASACMCKIMCSFLIVSTSTRANRYQAGVHSDSMVYSVDCLSLLSFKKISNAHYFLESPIFFVKPASACVFRN